MSKTTYLIKATTTDEFGVSLTDVMTSEGKVYRVKMSKYGVQVFVSKPAGQHGNAYQVTHKYPTAVVEFAKSAVSA